MSRLANEGVLQRSLFDEKNLAEIESDEYPGERLVACFNPLLADERCRKREALLVATEKELEKLSKQVLRRNKKPMKATQIFWKEWTNEKDLERTLLSDLEKNIKDYITI